MRPITFDQKLRILDHLAEEAHWGQAPFPAYLYDEQREARRGISYFPEKPRTPGVYRDHTTPEFFLKGGVDSGAYFNIVDFAPDEWPGFASDQLVNGIKLVVAFDCGIEPNLPYQNLAADSTRFRAFIKAQDGKEEVEGEELTLKDFAAALFNPMPDTTAFTGHWTGIPRRFSVSHETNAERVWMGPDQKTSVLAQGYISRIASNASHFALRKDSNFSSANIGKIIDLMFEGNQLDLSRNSWLCMRIETAHADQWAQKARHALSRELLMPSGHFGVVVFSPKDLILSVERNTFYKAVTARRASHELMKAIVHGDDDAGLMIDALNKGADLKYLDPDAAFGVANGPRIVRTFADYMKRHECYGMLAALRDREGIHGEVIKTNGKMSVNPTLGL